MFGRTPICSSVCGLVGVLTVATVVCAQDKSLLEQRPFDLITLDEANNHFQLKVQPLPFPGRRKPRSPRPNTKLRVVLMTDEPGEYEIFWRNIARVELYEELLLTEAERLRDAGQLDEAFLYYHALREKYPHLRRRVEPSIHRYLFVDARQLTQDRRFAEALGVVEELYRRNPRFKLGSAAPELIDFMGRLIDTIVGDQLDQKEYGTARRMLERIQAEYVNEQPGSIDRWVEQLRVVAVQKRDQARRHLDSLEYRQATVAVAAMTEIWPDVEGGAELRADLASRYPRIAVGVLQPAVLHDAHRIDNWGARRTGRLVRRSMIEFLGAGPEGGQYQFALGMFERSEDQRRLTLRLDQASRDLQKRISGHDVARRLIQLADPASAQYRAAWAGLLSATSVQDVGQVTVEFRRPHVLPEALLGIPLRPDSTTDQSDGPGDGPFRVESRDEQQVRFVRQDFQPGSRLAEVTERTFENTQQALAALRRGEIDVVDRIFPGDAARLRDGQSTDSAIAIQRYALPTVHMLLIDREHEFLANHDFRRALVFGIDRETILKRELLGDHEYAGCRVVSGPFPAGANDQDLLAYAYDETIAPRMHLPGLAGVLLKGASVRVKRLAEQRGDPEPRLKPLVLGYPAHEAARVAAQAIVADLNGIGLDCQLHQFPLGICEDRNDECDLVYVEIAIWEPLIDASRLFGATGLTPSDSAYVRRALRRLDQAESWGEVRERLLELHRAVYNEVTIIPLWQTVDSFAYDRRLHNLGESPVWLYQNVEQWRVGSAEVE